MSLTIDDYDIVYYRTLESLIKNSDGLYTKSGHYFTLFKDKYTNTYPGSTEDSECFFGITFDSEKERLIPIKGTMKWADYGTRSMIPYILYYIIDEHGVKAKYKLGGRGNLRDGWEPVKEKTKLVWERSETPSGRSEFAIEDEAKQRAIEEKKAISDYVGVIKDKLEIEATIVFKKTTPNEFGVSTLYIFEDEKGNKFKTFYSGHAWDAEKGETVTLKGTVKGHDEYKGEKSTTLTRVKLIEVEK